MQPIPVQLPLATNPIPSSLSLKKTTILGLLPKLSLALPLLFGALLTTTACSPELENNNLDGPCDSCDSRDPSNGPPPPAADVECSDGICVYDSIDQLAAELAIVFPRDGVNLRGTMVEELGDCVVARGFRSHAEWSLDYQYTEVGPELEPDKRDRFLPYGEGEYRTVKLQREDVEGGIRYTNFKRNTDIVSTLTLLYTDSGSLFSAEQRDVGEYFYNIATCVELSWVQ